MADGLLSGVLPAVYSGADAFKRKLIEALRNPGDTAANLLANANAGAAEHNALMDQEAAYTVAALKGGKVADALRGGPAGQKLTQSVADAYNPAGITVYHGSPHRFTKFDASKIGTGEGAKAYGHGIYVAESPGVAKAYRNALSNGRAPLEVTLDGAPFLPPTINFTNPDPKLQQLARLRTLLVQEKGNVDAAIARTYGDDAKALEAFRGRVSVGEPGSLYKVDLPDEHVARMLDWDTRLSEQINPALKEWFDSQKTYPGGHSYSEHTGNTLYGALKGRGLSADQASQQLRAAGIPGIRYLDQGSRGQGKGTSNFVVFPGNEGLLNIQEINGQPVQAVIDALRRNQQ